MKKLDPKIIEMLSESNAIEGVYDVEALEYAKKAWEYAVKNFKKTTHIDYILGIHRILMRPWKKAHPGTIRKCDVWVGGRYCPFEGTDKIADALGRMMEALTCINGVKEAEEWAKDLHVEFEKIHPFIDGNGRTGRILYNIHRLHLGLSVHILYEDERHKYYQWFK